MAPSIPRVWIHHFSLTATASAQGGREQGEDPQAEQQQAAPAPVRGAGHGWQVFPQGFPSFSEETGKNGHFLALRTSPTDVLPQASVPSPKFSSGFLSVLVPRGFWSPLLPPAPPSTLQCTEKKRCSFCFLSCAAPSGSPGAQKLPLEGKNRAKNGKNELREGVMLLQGAQQVLAGLGCPQTTQIPTWASDVMQQLQFKGKKPQCLRTEMSMQDPQSSQVI